MSAAELFEQLKTLPPHEQAIFARQFRQWESVSARAPRHRVQWPDPRVRHQRIFGDTVLPNMVLVAREEERF